MSRANVLRAAAFAFVALATPAAAEEFECMAIVGPDGAVTSQRLPGFSIEEQTPPFEPPKVEGELRSLTCMRDALYLVQNDLYVVANLGYPLMLGTMTEGDPRLLTFELIDGEFLIKVYDGAFTPAERRRVDDAVRQMGFRMTIQENLREVAQ